MMDEFANVALPKNFKISWQCAAAKYQLRHYFAEHCPAKSSLFKDDWEGIIGNC